MLNATDQFRDAIQSAGLTPPADIETDGKLRRFPSNGKRGDDSGWYVIHGDSIPAGSFGDWRTGISQSWRADIGRALSSQEEAAHRARIEAMRREREAEEVRRHEEARQRAETIWQAAKPVTDHPYLVRKGVPSYGLRVNDGRLIVPMRDGGEIHSLQTIGADSDKLFLPGGRVKGCYFSIGKPDGALCICEGYATGASIHEATGYAVAIAFYASNLLQVAKAIRAKFADLRVIVCADDDAGTEGNPGLTKAKEAALSIGAMLAVPNFGNDRPDSATDFNDMAQLHGTSAVKEAIARACAPAMPNHQGDGIPGPMGDAGGWPEPQPLTAKVAPEPYPIDALPATIRAAVEEVAGFVKAPVPMVASSALAALSLAAQAYIDAKRAERLQGPVGLFLLTIADSGERKSTCDGFFTSAIRQYQEEQAEAMKPAIKEHQAALAAWEAEREGILSAIKGAGRAGKPTDKLKRDLAELQQGKPESPRVPRLLLGDETPENLAWGLAKHWPSAGVVSSEAGVIFGSHGMSGESVMRNLGLLNVLWDGGSHSVGRRTSESFTVKGARLTVALQIQEATLRSFFDKSGGLARGTGFLARFMVAWPESTQGYRPFTEPPANWPHLAVFHRRIADILARPAPIDEEGALSPALMMLTPEAKTAWVEYHDTIEGELSSGRELYDVRDVASKSADNAARLAALFQLFEHGMGAISLECFESASLIAAWHLHEARRFFGELALPAQLANAARLDSWLIEYCQRERTHLVPTREAQRLGPVRDKEKLATALRELEEIDRVKMAQEGRRKIIKVNPALLEVTP